jgi:hypothetical protein
MSSVQVAEAPLSRPGSERGSPAATSPARRKLPHQKRRGRGSNQFDQTRSVTRVARQCRTDASSGGAGEGLSYLESRSPIFFSTSANWRSLRKLSKFGSLLMRKVSWAGFSSQAIFK